MEPFIRVRAREIELAKHTNWRKKLATKFLYRFGFVGSCLPNTYGRISFDVQLERSAAQRAVSQKNILGGMPMLFSNN